MVEYIPLCICATFSFFLLDLFLLEDKLFHNVVLVSATERESVRSIHTSPLSWTSFHPITPPL